MNDVGLAVAPIGQIQGLNERLHSLHKRVEETNVVLYRIVNRLESEEPSNTSEKGISLDVARSVGLLPEMNGIITKVNGTLSEIETSVLRLQKIVGNE